MSTDEAAQRLHEDVADYSPLMRDFPAHSNDVRALLAERAILHARIADREALVQLIDALEWNETDGDLRPWQYVIADLFVAYLTDAPDDKATT